uniref:hypothetical protein n=1 Tax=Chryseobacterium sp. C1 TaxID=2761531 RepID=UPI001E3311E4
MYSGDYFFSLFIAKRRTAILAPIAALFELIYLGIGCGGAGGAARSPRKKEGGKGGKAPQKKKGQEKKKTHLPF